MGSYVWEKANVSSTLSKIEANEVGWTELYRLKHSRTRENKLRDFLASERENQQLDFAIQESSNRCGELNNQEWSRRQV